MSISRDLLIINQRGLHARASAKFVQVAAGFQADIEVEKDGVNVGGTSIMGLMMLAASPGCTIRVTASGPEARQALAALDGTGFVAGSARSLRPMPPRGHARIKISLYPIAGRRAFLLVRRPIRPVWRFARRPIKTWSYDMADRRTTWSPTFRSPTGAARKSRSPKPKCRA